VDVAGFNYADNRYVDDGARYPNRVILGSETYPRDIASNWAFVEKLPYVIGDFTWTGWDYLGEAGIGKTTYGENAGYGINGEYPWLTAWCGDIDITGFRRPLSYWREVVWHLRKEPYIAVLRPEHYGEAHTTSPWGWSDSISSWTWPEKFTGKPVQVEVYSDADEVALLLNGKEIGRKNPHPTSPSGGGTEGDFKVLFDTVYEPGKLEAVNYRNGKAAERFCLTTAADEVSVKMKTETGDELSFVNISLVDRDGVINTACDRKLTASVTGPGVLQGFGSGAPVTEESFIDNEHTTFEGRALAVLRRTGEGTITFKIDGEDVTL
jgi:beta-galactosidase